MQLWYAGMRRKELEMADGQKIFYWDGGKGTPVFLVHGLGGSLLQDFAGAASWLARRHRVVCFDLPGFGLSYHYKFEHSIANHSDFLRDVMDRIGISKAHIIGNSMGGWISLKLAHRNPHRVLKLVLTASAGIRFSPPPLEVFTPETEDDVALLFSYLKVNAPKLPRWFLKDWLRHSRERRQSVRDMIHSMLTGLDLMDDFLTKIEAPTLLLWGDHDRLIPFEAGQRMHQLIPNSRLEIFPNKGHLLFHEAFSEMMPFIMEWLE